MTSAQQQLVKDISHKVEVFKNHGSSCSTRQYLSSAELVSKYHKRLTGALESEEGMDISELEEMSRDVDQILKNLGIKEST